MARVPYLTEEELPPEYLHLFGRSNPYAEDGDIRPEDAEGGGKSPWDGPQNTHRAIANNPEILDAYRRFGASVWTDAGLTPRQRELAILAVARALGSEYEWYQHVTVALRLGIPRDAIEALATGEFDALPDEEVALVEYLTAFAERSVDDETHAALSDHFDDATIVGLGMLAAYYIGIEYLVDALELDMEGEFPGWELENV